MCGEYFTPYWFIAFDDKIDGIIDFTIFYISNHL